MTNAVAAVPPVASSNGASQARWAIAGLSLSMMLSSLGTSIANVALPTLAEAFGASFSEVRWVVLAYLLAVTTLIVGLGRLGDLTGRRRLLLVGLVVFTMASVLCAISPSLWMLDVARAIQGAGAAVMMALTMAFVGDIVPKERTGRAMGLLGTMSAVGTALGPTLGGVLIAGFGWRAIFLVNLPLGIVALYLAYRYLPIDAPRAPRAPDRRTGFDFTSTATLALALAAGLSSSLIVSAVMMGTLIVGPFHLSRALGLDAATVGLVMSAGPLVAALVAAPAGRVVDRYGASRMSVVGLVGLAAGCLALSMLPATLGIPGYVIPMVVVTAGFALFQTSNNTAVMAGIDPAQRGVTSGFLNLSRNLGFVIGASVLGGVFAMAAGAADVALAHPDDIAQATRITFGVAAAMIVAALAIAVARGRSKT